MTNKQYIKGRAYEQKIARQARELGLQAVRSAGSKSKFDVLVIDQEKKIIELIQCKAGTSYSDSFKDKLFEELKVYEGTYILKVRVLDGGNYYDYS